MKQKLSNAPPKALGFHNDEDDDLVTPGYAHPWDGEPSSNRELRVVVTHTGEVIHRVDVHGKSDREVEKVLSGMLRNMNHEEYHVEDSADDKS